MSGLDRQDPFYHPQQHQRQQQQHPQHPLHPHPPHPHNPQDQYYPLRPQLPPPPPLQRQQHPQRPFYPYYVVPNRQRHHHYHQHQQHQQHHERHQNHQASQNGEDDDDDDETERYDEHDDQDEEEGSREGAAAGAIAVVVAPPKKRQHQQQQRHQPPPPPPLQQQTKKRKKGKWPRPDWNKSTARRRLQDAKEELDQARQDHEKLLCEQRAAHERLQLKQRQWETLQVDLVDDLLDCERERAWNKSYFQLADFYQRHGHCFLAVRPSTQHRRIEKLKKRQQQQLSFLNDSNSHTTTTTTTNEAADDTNNHTDNDNAFGADNDSDNDNSNNSTQKNGSDDRYDPVMLKWVAKQRCQRNKGTLEEWKIAALDRLNFIWDAREATWRENYQRLKAYHAIHGHIKVTRNQDQSLQRWLKFQVASYADYKERGFTEPDEDNKAAAGMNKERRELLEALGMDWKDADARWIVLFNKLKCLYQKQGHLKTIPEGQQNLAQFVDKQRKAYQVYMENGRKDSNDGMTAERVTLLESIQFPWSEQDDNDDETNNNSAAAVAVGGAVAPGASTTATAAAASAATANHAMTKHDAEWMTYYNKVKAFVRKYQHFAYTEEPSEPKDHTESLQQWDDLQRQHYSEFYAKRTEKKKNSPPGGFDCHLYLTPERLELLQNVGFFESEQDREWYSRMAELRRFHIQHGHCLIMYDYPGTENRQYQKLAAWAIEQREEYKKYRANNNNTTLTEERIHQMTLLGFNWDLPPPPPGFQQQRSNEETERTTDQCNTTTTATTTNNSANGSLPTTQQQQQEPRRKRGRPRKTNANKNSSESSENAKPKGKTTEQQSPASKSATAQPAEATEAEASTTTTTCRLEPAITTAGRKRSAVEEPIQVVGSPRSKTCKTT